MLSNSATKWYRWMQLAGLAVFLACSGCHPSTPPGQQPLDSRNDVLKRGIGGEPASLDPGKADDTFSFEVIRDLYEGLTTESADGEVEPGVASAWTINASGTVYTFEIRRDAKWSNGQKIVAQDFVSSWRRVADPKQASPVADLLRPIANAADIIAGRLPPERLGVYAAADGRLVVQLAQPAPYFLQLLTHSLRFPCSVTGIWGKVLKIGYLTGHMY